MVDTHAFPARGGWVFRQSQTNWTNNMAMVGFKASVDNIRKHRLANPAIAAKYNLSADPAVIEKELIAFQQARGSLPPTQPTFFQPSSSRLPSRVVAAAADIKRAAQGTAVVLDWLTSGGAPVAQALANKRAATCIGCVKNVEGSWFTTAPAELIRSTLEARKDLVLVTPSDAALKSCDVCKCLNRLKVWCPMTHIAAKTKPEIMAEFPSNCWIAKRDA